MTTPDSYAFNEHFTPLPVLNQGQSPTCVNHTRATLVDAFRRVWDGKDSSYDADNIQWGADPDDPACTLLGQNPDGPFKLYNASGCAPHYWENHGTTYEEMTPQAMKDVIYANGVAEIGTASRSKGFEAVSYGLTSMPLVKLRPDEEPYSDTVIDHDITAVGFTPDGIIIQNSWSLSWGYRGRAVLAWDFIEHFNCRINVYGYNGHPVDSATIPAPHQQPVPPPVPHPTPTPHPKGKFMLIKKAGHPQVYMVLGGCLSWIPNGAVLTAQGYRSTDVQTIPNDSPLWKLPVLPSK